MNTKRFFSIVLAIVLIVSCMGFSASAEGSTVTLSLQGESNAVIGAEYKVSLNVSESAVDTVGGLSCDITYETEKFTLVRAELASDFAAANYIEADGYSELIRDNNGTISVMLLDVNDDQAENKWITFVFEVLNSEEAATFKFGDNAQVSDAAGVTLIESELIVDIVRDESGTIDFYQPQTNTNGASIKKDVTDEEGNIVGNIRFEAQLGSSVDKSTIEEIGFLLLPTKFLNNGDLTITDEYAESDTDKRFPLYTMADGRKISISKNGIAIDKLTSESDTFYCYFTNTMSYPLTMSYSARPYVKLKSGEYIYGYNNDSDKNISDGTSSKNCVDIAKAIYNLYKESYEFSSDVIAIIDKESTAWDTTDYQKVVNELAKCEDSLH